MSEAPNRTAAQVGPEAYENDFRPGVDTPSDYALSLMPPEVRAAYDARQRKPEQGSGQAEDAS